MNKAQISSLVIATVARVCAFLFRPYGIDGQFMDGFVFVFFTNPIPPDGYIAESFLYMEALWIAFTLFAALIGLALRAKFRQGVVFWVGLALEIPLLALGIFPQLMVGAYLIWQFLEIYAFVLFALILGLGIERLPSSSARRLRIV